MRGGLRGMRLAPHVNISTENSPVRRSKRARPRAAAVATMALQSINPATGEPIERYEEMSAADVDTIVKRSNEAFQAWREKSFAERGNALRATAQILRREAEPLARLMALEMGKPLREGIAEAQKCATCCDYYAE